MAEPEPSEAFLIREAAAGNAGAFSELVRLHRMQVLRTAYGVLGSTDEAEDVAQEVFIKVWNSLPGYTPQGSFSSWLYRVTVNAAIDALRRKHREVPLDEPYADPGEKPEEGALRKAETLRVRAAIRTLPEGSRTALVLREYEQLSYKEIADILNIPIGTVMSRLNYARQALKKQLER